ncbi:MAG: signal transduction histidine kinase [Psychromonas sp.]
MIKTGNSRLNVLVIILLVTTVFVFDQYFFPNRALAQLYILPIFFSFFFVKSKSVYTVAALVSLMVLLTHLESFETVSKKATGVLTLIIVWVSAYSIHQFKRDKIKIEAQKRRYERLSNDLSQNLDAKVSGKLDIKNRDFDRLNSAISAGGVGIWEWDVKKNRVFFDEQCFLLFGLSMSEEDLNYHWLENSILKDDRIDFSTEIQNTIRGESQLNVEVRVVWPDNNIRHIKMFGRYVHNSKTNEIKLVGTLWDLTDNKRVHQNMKSYQKELEQSINSNNSELMELNEALQLKENFHNEMSNIGQIGGWEMFLPDRKVDWTNQVSVILGLEENEMLSFEMFVQMFIPENRGVLLTEINNSIEGKRRFELELQLVKKDQKLIWIRIIGVPNVVGNEVRMLSGILQDVTYQRSLNNSLVVLNEELGLKTQEKMEELSVALVELETFSYTISHDLREPLRAIEGFSKALKDNYAGILDEDGIRWLNFIIESTDKMGGLITDILQFSRVGRMTIQPIELDMNKLIEEKFDQLKQGYLEKNLKLKVEKLPEISGDRAMIGTVWQYLLDNALKFSSNNDIIQIDIDGKKEGDFVIYSIKDYGSGFDQKFVSKLFVVFQRLHANDEFKGSGVGLAIVNRIITKHGGWTRAEGIIDGGALITFGLPLS